ncbi:type VII secretion-associated serine protease mycosin [Streptomyces sp. NPDC088745]|uniref:type VII secretion-associated serine protease mycosin n=1 Tax=Streptomyces sp. NPDC088745 TaxID=3365884 RepID=UPI0037F30B97
MSRTRNTYRGTALRCAATFALAVLCLPSAQARGQSEATAGQEPCTVGSAPYGGRPWSLRRLPLNEIWEKSTTRGRGIRVAVIDTGVDARHPQLRDAVDPSRGRTLPLRGVPRGPVTNGTHDEVGHGTEVAGIIAARPRPGTGFVGLAPEATIIPIDQNDARGGGTPATLAQAIEHAMDQNADIINISQDTADTTDPPGLERAVRAALRDDIVVIASAGNSGSDGTAKRTYPASYDGVLAVAAADRDNERAHFSQTGDFVGIAAPGTDIVSTFPGGGHCTDSGTSFSAPYVAGLAALLRGKHRGWTAAQVVTRIQQTAERPSPGPDALLGWGVADPLRALTDDARPAAGRAPRARTPDPLHAPSGETPQERTVRLAVYVVTAGAVALATLTGTAVAVRDARRRRRTPQDPGT